MRILTDEETKAAHLQSGWKWKTDPNPIRAIVVDRKDVTGKINPLLMPYEALAAFSVISDYGFNKYGNRHTWQNNPPDEGVIRYLNAGARHAYKAAQGEEFDPENNLPHVYANLWNAAVACWHYERGKEAKIYADDK